jgi:peroxiredoxin Q/BCP
MKLLLAALVVSCPALALAVDIGDRCPEFEARDDSGKLWKSSEHIGKGDKILVIYFYPADLTGGCTAQACAFRDDMKKLKDKNVEVVGISGDSVKNHQFFKKVHNLNFTLLADEQGEVAAKFGVPVKKGGVYKFKKGSDEATLTRGVTAARWTFVVNKQGKIVLKETKVIAANDSKAVLKLVESLKD